MEKTKGQEEFNEEKPVLDFPSHFFEGNDVQDEVQEILTELDHIDPITRADDVMTKSVQELVEKTAALSRSQSDV